MLIASILPLLLGSPIRAEVDLPQPDTAAPITIEAAAGNSWRQGQYEVWILRGNCRIAQGSAGARADEAVVWIDRAAADEHRPSKVIAYLDGEVALNFRGAPGSPRLADRYWFGRFFTITAVQVHAAEVAGRPDVMPAVYHRAEQQMQPRPADTAASPSPGSNPVRPAQFTAPTLGEPTGVPPRGARRIRVFPRGDVPVQAQWFPDPNSNQWIALIDSGVNLIVDGLPEFGSIDVVTDRLVIWTQGLEEPDLTGARPQGDEIPLEIYLEGNIVFRQGERVIYADRMYYDVANQRGTVLGAEMLTPVPNYEGLLRLRAEMLQQLGRGQYLARDSFLTSSRMGRPRYRIQSDEIYFEDIQRPAVDLRTGQPLFDPATGQPLIDHDRLATSRNNFLYLGEVPIFYWPTLATNLESPTFYLRNARLKNDDVYGTQLLTTWNAYELFGIRQPPAGTQWDLSLDWLGKRGLGHGTMFLYDRDDFFNIPGPTAGLADYWAIDDHGLDDLGQGRMDLEPEVDYRYRLFWQHRQQLRGDYQLTAEVGWISDRNFLEEYYEREWDELKDQTTGLELKRVRDSTSWSVSADIRPNEFFTETEWLPRADHFALGFSLFRDRLTWYEHSSAGYARLRTATTPENPSDAALQSTMPWEIATEGERLITRQEIDYPLQFGPVKVVPYALGELGHWGEDLTGDDVQRFYYQTGIRASMPAWRVDPTVENQLLNLHGLAHKVVFDAELSVAESNRDLSLMPLYEQLDDNAVEAARRHFRASTFGEPPGAPLPLKFDERFYALRRGLGQWVASPAMEVADDLAVFRVGAHQRWQTKRGMPGRRRIIDWITLDTHMSLFPDASDDNFGDTLGLLDYDLRWHVGDRLTLVSDGVFDFFDDGQKVVTVGGFLSRPPRGDLYLGLRILEGPISHQILTFSYSYWMSPKWVSSFGTSVDLGDEGNIGQNFSVTRIGESLLVSAGMTFDAARDNFGVRLAIEPRFLPTGRLGRVGGAQIPPAGLFGLE